MFEEIRVFPTQGAQCLMKARLTSAQRSYVLLKRKADSLGMQFRKIIAKLIKEKSVIQEVMKEASLSLAEVKYITGSLNQFVIESADKATVKVLPRSTIIAGLNIQTYEYHVESLDTFAYTGLARGGQQVVKVKSNYRKALEVLIKLASLQTSFVTLMEHIRLTNRRVNVLYYIIIPRLARALGYIASELEEYEREETYRLKRVQARKRKMALKTSKISKSQNTSDGKNMDDFDEYILF